VPARAARAQAGAELARLPPAKKDAIKILSGEQRGQTGQLLGVDHSDGIVKLDANLDIKILPLALLARLHDPARPPDAG
jgi:transcription elongation factor SPT5